MNLVERKKRKENISALLIALMLSCNSLSRLLNFIPGISAIIVIVAFFVFLFINGWPNQRKNISTYIVFIAIIFLGFIRQILSGHWCNPVALNFMSFCVFGIPFIYLNYYRVNYIRILEYLAFLGVILVPLNIREFMLEYISLGTEDAQMVASYNILFFIIPSAIIIFSSTRKYIKYIAAIESFIGLIFLMSFGSKGAVLAMLIGCLLVLMYRNNRPIKLMSSKVLIVGALVIVLISNFEIILTYVNDVLEQYGIYSSAIPELLSKIASEDMDQLSSGRNLIYEQTIKSIYQRPILGYGIGAFDNYSGKYPHNLFLHLMYEGGIIIFLPYIVLLIRLLNQLNGKYQDLETRYFIIFIITAGIVRLIFSYVYWESHLFWFSIGLVLKSISIRK